MNDVGGEKELDWLCRRYTEEVWVWMFPDYKGGVPPDNEFLEDVERCHEGEIDASAFRAHYVKLVQEYAWSGLLFKWWSDSSCKTMFANYSKESKQSPRKPKAVEPDWSELIQLGSIEPVRTPRNDWATVVAVAGTIVFFAYLIYKAIQI